MDIDNDIDIDVIIKIWDFCRKIISPMLKTEEGFF